MDRSALQALLTRAENATGPDREIDGGIWKALTEKTGDVWSDNIVGDVWHLQDPQDTIAYEPPPYITASIDAALALCERMLPGWAWQVSKIEGVPSRAPTRDCEVRLWLPGIRTQGLPVETVTADAATPALAILAATVRAILAQPAEKTRSDMPV